MDTEWEAEFSRYAEARAITLRNLAYLVCGDWHRAEDHAQTALIRIYLSWQRIERRDTLDRYARTVLVRTVLEERRRPWRRERATAELPDVSAPDGLPDAVAERLAVGAALADLPPRQRAAVVLRYWADQSVADTAQLLGVTEGTVKASCSRGLVALRAALQGTQNGGHGRQEGL